MLIETVLGAVTGLIGNGIQAIFNYKTTKIKNDHEEKMVELETAAMVTEAKANIAITRAQIEGATELADASAYIEAQKAEQKNLFGVSWVDKLLAIEGKWKWITLPVAVTVAFLFGIIDFVRGGMRPALTGYLVLLSTWVTVKSYELLELTKSAFTQAQALEIFQDATSIIIYLTVSAVTFWFGDRRMAKTIMTLHGADRTKIDDDIKI